MLSTNGILTAKPNDCMGCKMSCFNWTKYLVAILTINFFKKLIEAIYQSDELIVVSFMGQTLGKKGEDNVRVGVFSKYTPGAQLLIQKTRQAILFNRLIKKIYSAKWSDFSFAIRNLQHIVV